MTKDKKVTISLLTWNGSRYLPWLIKSIQDQTYSNWQLLVLDNASTDDSVAVVRQAMPEVKIMQQTKNIGFARGHNQIINWSDSDYVLVINQDVMLEKDYIKKCVDFLDKNPQVASVAGKLMYWDFNGDNKSKIIDSFGIKIDHRRHARDAFQGQKDFETPNQPVFGLSGAVLMLRRQALDSIGWPAAKNNIEYFDEDFFAYKEDIDLAWRLRLAGWENWLITNTRAYHHRTVSGGKDIRFLRKHRALANKMSYRNHLMTIYKNSFWKNLWRDFIPIKWYEFKKFIFLLIFERSTLAGLKEYWQKKKVMKQKRRFVIRHAKVTADDIYQWFQD